MTVEFECRKCGKGFKYDWHFDDVTCPHCSTKWETDYETNFDDDIQGPWLYGEVEEKK